MQILKMTKPQICIGTHITEGVKLLRYVYFCDIYKNLLEKINFLKKVHDDPP